jgi:hypothetical protein
MGASTSCMCGRALPLSNQLGLKDPDASNDYYTFDDRIGGVHWMPVNAPGVAVSVYVNDACATAVRNLLLQYNVLTIGYVGAGKSSLLNTISAVCWRSWPSSIPERMVCEAGNTAVKALDKVVIEELEDKMVFFEFPGIPLQFVAQPDSRALLQKVLQKVTSVKPYMPSLSIVLTGMCWLGGRISVRPSRQPW